MQQENTTISEFSKLGIAPDLLSKILQKFKIPTPIQKQVIPQALSGKDLVGIAETGSGKTLAFGIPLIQRLRILKGQGLVLAPTRELALQISEMLITIDPTLNRKIAVVIGGASFNLQAQSLRRNPQIIIATPGRLIDHLRRRVFSLRNFKVVVLDEADRMFDIGFLPQIKGILDQTPRSRQTLLFSATMPDSVTKLTLSYMIDPIYINVSPEGKPPAMIEQEIYLITREAKITLLAKILTDTDGTVLVFSRTKHNATRITKQICNLGHRATEIHSNRSQNQRKTALDGFKSGKYRVLVATDIAARGIDVRNISMVINYDLPDHTEDYLHRIGRTGRAGKKGKALSFATFEEQSEIRTIERLIKKELPFFNSDGTPMPRPNHFDQKITRSFSGRRFRSFNGRRRHR